MSILIRDGFLVTMNEARETFARGYVVVDGDGRIASAGPMEQAPAGTYEDIIDAGGMIVVPGLINALQRPGQALLRGRWRADGSQQGLTANDLRISASVSALEMIRSGTTCCVAHTDEADADANTAIAGALHGSGLRGVIAMPFDTARRFEEPEAAFAKIEEMLAASAHVGEGRIQGALALELHQSAGNRAAAERWLVAVYRFACERNLMVCAPVGTQSELTQAVGRSDVMYLMELGVLDSRWLLAHAVDASDTDIALMREAGCSVVVTPVSESMRGLGIGRCSAMLRAGINCTLGSDGAGSGASVDMIEQIKACLILQNANLLDPNAFSAVRSLEMATIGGARALGLDRLIGSIERGKRADIAIFDLRGPHFQVAHRPISNLVCSGSGRDVHAVLIDGKVVVRNRRFVDATAAAATMREAQKAAHRLRDGARTAAQVRKLANAVH